MEITFLQLSGWVLYRKVVFRDVIDQSNHVVNI